MGRATAGFNLTVEGTHTYLVGADGVLVHNVGKKCTDGQRVTRFGDPVSKEELARQAAAAKKNPGINVHGVSVSSKPGPNGNPLIEEVEKSFPVHKTGGRSQ